MKFKNISFLRFFLLTLSTFGLYVFFWALDTKRALNKAGGSIPNGFLMALPVLNLYFWYKYAQAYVAIVKKTTRDQDVLFYFLVPVLANSVIGLSFKNLLVLLEKEHLVMQNWFGCTAAGILVLISFIAIYVTLFLYTSGVSYLFYQKGFNEYQE
jgi:hypothetical protein